MVRLIELEEIKEYPPVHGKYWYWKGYLVEGRDARNSASEEYNCLFVDRSEMLELSFKSIWQQMENDIKAGFGVKTASIAKLQIGKVNCFIALMFFSGQRWTPFNVNAYRNLHVNNSL